MVHRPMRSYKGTTNERGARGAHFVTGSSAGMSGARAQELGIKTVVITVARLSCREASR
jgi:hypothetical protein